MASLMRLQSSEGSTGEGSACKLSHVLVSWPSFLTGCLPETSVPHNVSVS